MLALAQFLDKVWLQYSAANPQAVAIEQLFKSEGETPVNDHIAFRTFADSRISIDILEIELFALGYHLLDNYQFETKQLDARCYIHDQSPTKIFISELRWQQLSPAAQAVIVDLIEQTYVTLKSPVLDQNSVNISPLLTAGRLWRLPSYCQYRLLLAESEYAAWLSVWGLRANHFTVFVNMLNKYSRLEQVVALLQQQGYRLNQVGGIIKGTEHDLLIQQIRYLSRPIAVAINVLRVKEAVIPALSCKLVCNYQSMPIDVSLQSMQKVCYLPARSFLLSILSNYPLVLA